MQGLTLGPKGTWLATMKETLRSHRSNKHAVIEICAKTIQKYFKKWNLRRVTAKSKNTGRTNAYNDIRTPLSLCCLMDTLQKVVNRVNYQSIGTSSVF